MVNRFALMMNHSPPGWTARLPLFLAPLWCNLTPIKISPLDGVCSSFGQAAGHIIFFKGNTLERKETSRKYLIKDVIRACRKVARLRCRILGLDPVLARTLGDTAVNISRKFGLTITGGLGGTAAAVIESLGKIADLMDLILDEASVLVMGAAEPLGSVCAQILAREGVNYLTLMDSDVARLDKLARWVLYDSGVACKISTEAGRAVARADIVIVAGEAGGSMLHPRDLKPSAIVCNPGLSDGLSLDIMQERSDVMAFDGVVVRPPGTAIPDCGLGLPEGCIYAWMAEAIILALEGSYDRYFLGEKLHVEKIAALRRLAVKHGFKLSGFIAANQYLDFDTVKGIKNKLFPVC